MLIRRMFRQHFLIGTIQRQIQLEQWVLIGVITGHLYKEVQRVQHHLFRQLILKIPTLLIMQW